MALYSHEYTLYNCSPTGLKVNSKYWGGEKYEAVGRADLTGLLPGNATVENSKAYLVRLPAGAMVTGGQLHWEGPAGGGSGLGAASAVTIGDNFNCQRFLSLTSTAANSESLYGVCGRFNVMDRNAVPMNAQYLNVEYTGILYEYTCDTDIVLYAANGAAAGLQGHVRLVVDYKLV